MLTVQLSKPAPAAYELQPTRLVGAAASRAAALAPRTRRHTKLILCCGALAQPAALADAARAAASAALCRQRVAVAGAGARLAAALQVGCRPRRHTKLTLPESWRADSARWLGPSGAAVRAAAARGRGEAGAGGAAALASVSHILAANSAATSAADAHLVRS